MNTFRGILVVLFLALLIYTVVVGMHHGWNFLPVFFGDLMRVSWPGQFNFDFLCFLILSGIWIAWRNNLTPAGWATGVIVGFCGFLGVAAYLFIVSFKANGDFTALLLGKRQKTG